MFTFRSLSTLFLTVAGSAFLASASLGQNVTFCPSAGSLDPASAWHATVPYANFLSVGDPTYYGDFAVKARYNILPTADLTRGNNTALVVNFLDNGPDAHIIVRLWEHDLYTGTPQVRMTFDSDSYTSHPYGQTQVLLSTFDFSFTTKCYFLEVELHRKTVSGGVWLGGMQLYRY